MTDLERMAIEHACSKLVVAFYNRDDEFDHEAILRLFTEDAVWDHLVAGRLDGKSKIGAYLNSKNTNAIMKHMVTNIEIDVIDGNRAKGKSYYTFYASPTGAERPAELKGPMAVGHYDDEFVRTAGGWRFSRRSTSISFEASHRGDYSLLAPDASKTR